ncbi:MAG: hypothetical protein ACJA1L_000512 [Paracoccaceae bacterium]|jgi:hypothetical protein
MNRILAADFNLAIGDLHLGDGSAFNVANLLMMRRPHIPVIVLAAARVFAEGQLYRMAANIVSIFRKAADFSDPVEFAAHVVKRGLPAPEDDCATLIFGAA